MTALPKYRASDLGRFDFRIPDGLGSYVYPDWADPNLKVEIYDADGVLQATITPASTPPMTKETDATGDFVAIEGLDLSAYAVGAAEVRIYCQVSSADVLPYPTIMDSFEVMADTSGVAYTTTTRVKADLPGSLPTDLTDSLITGYILDNSRIIDGYLGNLYTTPFADIADTPPTPAIIERICRLFTLGDCWRFMGKVNNVEDNQDWAQGMKMLDEVCNLSLRVDTPAVGPSACGEITRTDDLDYLDLALIDSESEP